MTIVVIGSKGQLGSDLCAGWGADATGLTHADIEISSLESVQSSLSSLDPVLVVNCAAYNKVDLAEDEPGAALAVNARGPRNLAEYCATADIPLVHVSTDYVFSNADSDGTPFDEQSTPKTESAYGKSKLAGEHYVAELCPKHYIVRTCGLYGHAGRLGNGNFVETMLRLGAERDQLRVVNDQTCTPTLTSDLADWIIQLVESGKCGLYHASNGGQTTWFGFAQKIMELADLNTEVVPITTAEFGARAVRPPFSVLDTSKLAAVIGSAPRPWEDALADYVKNRTEK